MQVNDDDPEAVAEMLEIKKSIESGEFQRDMRKSGIRKITATFEYADK